MATKQKRRPGMANLARRLAGLAWLGAWLWIVATFHLPWRDLGGLVPESVRYWERVVLTFSAIGGGFVGATVRDAVRPGTGRTHASLLRYVVGCPAAAVACALVILQLRGADEWIGVVTVGFVAWWAGLDASVGAVPLILGRAYSATAAIDDAGAEPFTPAGSDPADPWR